jgi:hypothetical protein
MIDLGKKQDWAEEKMNEYISKKNYYKIINIINKKLFYDNQRNRKF